MSDEPQFAQGPIPPEPPPLDLHIVSQEINTPRRQLRVRYTEGPESTLEARVTAYFKDRTQTAFTYCPPVRWWQFWRWSQVFTEDYTLSRASELMLKQSWARAAKAEYDEHTAAGQGESVHCLVCTMRLGGLAPIHHVPPVCKSDDPNVPGEPPQYQRALVLYCPFCKAECQSITDDMEEGEVVYRAHPCECSLTKPEFELMKAQILAYQEETDPDFPPNVRITEDPDSPVEPT